MDKSKAVTPTLGIKIEKTLEGNRFVNSSSGQDSKPRSRGDSIHSHGSVEGSSKRRTRSRSTVRGLIREQDGIREEGELRDRRQGDDSTQTYLESSGSQRRSSKSYYSGGGYNRPIPSTSYGTPSTIADTGRGDATGTGLLTRDLGSLSISNGDNYTLAPPGQSTIYSSTLSTSQYGQSYTQPDSFQPVSQQSVSQQPVPQQPRQPRQPPAANTGQKPNRHIRGTRGASEKIDATYSVRQKDYKDFFRIGRVFSTLWSDPLGANANRVDPTFVSEVVYQERVYSKIRRFIVVREGDRSVTCLPVTSYDGAGPYKKGITLGDHGFIYSQRKPEPFSGMCQRSLRLDLAKGAAHLQDPSLVNYGKVYTVETNVKVKNVGQLDADSKGLLKHYFWKVFSDGEKTGGDITPRASGADLAGVGAGLSNYNDPAQNDSMQPSLNHDVGSTARGLPNINQYYRSQNPSSAAGAVDSALSTFTYTYDPAALQAAGSTPGTSPSMYSNSNYPQAQTGGWPGYSRQSGAGGHYLPTAQYPSQYMNTTDAPIAASPYQVAVSPQRAAVNSSLHPQGETTFGSYQQTPTATGNYYQQGGAGTTYGGASVYYEGQGTSSGSGGGNCYPNQQIYLTSAPLTNPSRDTRSGSYDQAWQYGSSPQPAASNAVFDDDEEEDGLNLPSLESAQAAAANKKKKRHRHR